MTGPALEVAQRASAELGEGPTWDAAAERLVWVDILGSEVHRFDPATGASDVLRTSQHVGAAKPCAGGGLVLNLRDGVALVDAVVDGGGRGGVPDLDAEADGRAGAGGVGGSGGERWRARWPREGCRGNDAAVDAAGRLWAGTMRYDEATGGGRLFCVGPGGAVVTVLDSVTISNGIGWSPDDRRMYYVDTPTRRIDVFDVDPAVDPFAGVDDPAGGRHPDDPDPSTGLSGRRPLVELGPDVAGSPDGLTVDAEGCVWVVLWGGAAIRRYTPAGRLDRVVPVPVSRPTACAFGGPGLHDLYITSAREPAEGPAPGSVRSPSLAGSLLVLPGAGTGLPGHAFLP
jgi:sugar lactone lactonase YvrE